MTARKVVRVTYLDHTSYEGERTLEELRKAKPAQCVAVGEVLSETDDTLTVLCYYERAPPGVEHDGKVDIYALVILKCAVVKREELT